MSRLFNEKEKTKMINQYLKKTSILSSAPRLLFRTFAARGASGHGWYHKFKKDFAKGESDPVPFPEPINNVERKKVYMELDGIEDLSSTKITFELCNDIAPKTCENFMKLCTHDNGHGYKGTIFHQILKNEVAVGGDIDGKGGVSSLVKLESGIKHWPSSVVNSEKVSIVQYVCVQQQHTCCLLAFRVVNGVSKRRETRRKEEDDVHP